MINNGMNQLNVLIRQACYTNACRCLYSKQKIGRNME